MILAISTLLSIATLLVVYLAGENRRSAWALGFAIQPVWIGLAVATEAYGLILLSLALLALYGRNWLMYYALQRRQNLKLIATFTAPLNESKREQLMSEVDPAALERIKNRVFSSSAITEAWYPDTYAKGPGETFDLGNVTPMPGVILDPPPHFSCPYCVWSGRGELVYTHHLQDDHGAPVPWPADQLLPRRTDIWSDIPVPDGWRRYKPFHEDLSS